MKPHPGRNSLINYLKKGFPWKEDWEAESIGHTFTHSEVKEALKRLMITDPKLYRLLSYRWQTNRARSSIASHVYLDPSTLKRNWDVAINILANYLINKDVTENLDSIDIGYD